MSTTAYSEILQTIPHECRLVAVSKLQSNEKIKNLYEKGQRIFAENYVQEALQKQNDLHQLEIEWHFIGHLQKNKVKQIIGKFNLIHSIDSKDLLDVLHKQLLKNNQSQNILLEINLANEKTKGGFSKDELENLLPSLGGYSQIQIQGLMTMPPLFENPNDARPFFKELRLLRDQIQKILPSCRELSMGTSSDYKIALEEGATLVRLGTVLFGERIK